MDTLTVESLMTPHPHLANPGATLRAAASKMKEYDCGCLVVGHDHENLGIITDRDIVIFGLAEGCNPDETIVEDIMTHGAITCYDSDTLEAAADMMSINDVRRLVVLDSEDRVVGVISVTDIIKCPDKNVVNDDIMHHLYKYA